MTIHILGLEPIESRYTYQWDTIIPEMFESSGTDTKVYRGRVVQTNIGNSSDFLAWIPSNIWKSTQLAEFATAMLNGRVKDGDVVFVTDFWNPAAINIRYMADMTGLDLKLVGFAHAGFYDPWDRLGIQLKDTQWASVAESAIIACYDKLIFATEFHRKLFEQQYGSSDKNVVLPFFGNYIKRTKPAKADSILFCQRNAPEKQPEMFDRLKSVASDCVAEWISTCDKPLPHREYIERLKSAKFVVSFALQETLGIVPFEALANGCCIIVPDRLSYSEMYTDDVKYDGSIEDCERVLRRLAALPQDRLDKIIEENYNKARVFFDGTPTVEFIKGL